ncbi:MAG: alkaline phosphatase D family protein [Chitinophagaceae bacterium]|nr:alkaline phosphatase D family protein [Chitinophagaceae bacterium]
MKKKILCTILISMYTACNTIQKPNSINNLYNKTLKPFYYGVASGDVSAHEVVLWTKVVPDHPIKALLVNWKISPDSLFQTNTISGIYTTDSINQHTVKVTVDNLLPDTYYYYTFSTFGIESLQGRTKTAPDMLKDSITFGVVSCANYEHGYFNAYSALAKQKNIEAIIHLGDYIYEYGKKDRKQALLIPHREHLPQNEIISLQDYRTRYAQYSLDPDLILLRQKHPLFAIWDDHEFANNTYKEGADNHSPETEGTFETRKKNALQAYYEWIPLKTNIPDPIYRKISYGKLVDIFLLEERIEGRTKQTSKDDTPSNTDTTKSILGTTQRNWILNQIQNSSAIWKIIGNPVLFSSIKFPFTNWDNWNGYPHERNIITTFLKNNHIKNIVFLTGDSHCSMALPITENFSQQTHNSVGVEFLTPSINSGNTDEYKKCYKCQEALAEQAEYIPNNPNLTFVDVINHGFMTITLQKDKAIAKWFFVKTLSSHSDSTYLAKTITVNINTTTLLVKDNSKN